MLPGDPLGVPHPGPEGPSPPDEVYEVFTVAHKLKVSQEFVYREIRAGKLPAIRLGRRQWRIARADLTAYLEAGRHAVGRGRPC